MTQRTLKKLLQAASVGIVNQKTKNKKKQNRMQVINKKQNKKMNTEGLLHELKHKSTKARRWEDKSKLERHVRLIKWGILIVIT